MNKLTRIELMHKILLNNPDGVPIHDLKARYYIENPGDAVMHLRNGRLDNTCYDIETYLIKKTASGAAVNGYRLRGGKPAEAKQGLNAYIEPPATKAEPDTTNYDELKLL